MLGSPPRMRGKAAEQTSTIAFLGITPALAGKSYRTIHCRGGHRDHPRTCGEKQMEQQAGRVWVGSPPHMRGKVHRHSFLNFISGITPAYAGKSSYMPASAPASKDHPRICGEKFSGRLPATTAIGSPPHMRGKGNIGVTTTQEMRITPAYAGKSSHISGHDLCVWDHPRICGEKFPVSPCLLLQLGSPPHMRGKATLLSKN